MSPDSEPDRPPARADRFATTHWSVVVRAGRGRTPGAGRALAALCENYWFPLYAFVRRAGHAADEAQDLTQAFFAELLAKDVLAVADPRRGKFRSFLQGAIKHFLAKQQRRQGRRSGAAIKPWSRSISIRVKIAIAASSRPTTSLLNDCMKNAGPWPCWTSSSPGCGKNSPPPESCRSSIA